MKATIPLKKIFTFFLLSFLVINFFPFPLSEIPFLEVLADFYFSIADYIIIWFGKTILNIPTLTKIEDTGSGDTTFDYVKMLWDFIVAVVATITFFLLFDKKNYYSRFAYWATTYCRYYLGLNLIFYGLIKFFQGQFPPTALWRLEENFGDATPMGLLWTFIGHSHFYGFFAGMTEVIAGFMVLYHRTKIVGAILAFMVMLNVVMMNFCFDVPVKLFSTQLLVISLLLLAPNLQRLYNFFILNKSETLIQDHFIFQTKWKRNIQVYGKILYILILISLIMIPPIMEKYSEAEETLKKPLVGCYPTSKFYVKDKDTMSENHLDTIRWKKYVIGKKGFTIFYSNDSVGYYLTKIDKKKPTDTITF